MDDGTAELIKLAELLRLGLATTRDIAAIRPRDYCELMDVVARAETMADDLDRITGVVTKNKTRVQ